MSTFKTKAPFATSLILAGMVAAGAAQANPYASWQSSVSDDDQVTIQDSFKSDYESSYSEDNDVDIDLRKKHSEDNDIALDYSSSYKSSEDNDITKTISKSEDNDFTKTVTKSQDNDVTTHWANSEDNDIMATWTNTEDNDYTHTEDNDVDVDVDFQIATATLTSDKYQHQDAGHEGSQTVLGMASGHEVGVKGATNLVSAGNDEQRFYGPAMVNDNVNQLPVNNAFVGGDSYGMSQDNTFAGRDMGSKGVFAPIGNTHATVVGDVGQASSAGMRQSGDASNGIADVMSAPISK